VLGLKGTMSEAELHLIRSRLTAGLKHKAAKGELRQGLPVGLDYDENDKVVLCADEAVREAIITVFRCRSSPSRCVTVPPYSSS
jgi:DNA invertase Pin-like site-specific DNA recombinase